METKREPEVIGKDKFENYDSTIINIRRCEELFDNLTDDVTIGPNSLRMKEKHIELNERTKLEVNYAGMTVEPKSDMLNPKIKNPLVRNISVCNLLCTEVESTKDFINNLLHDIIDTATKM